MLKQNTLAVTDLLRSKYKYTINQCAQNIKSNQKEGHIYIGYMGHIIISSRAVQNE